MFLLLQLHQPLYSILNFLEMISMQNGQYFCGTLGTSVLPLISECNCFNKMCMHVNLLVS